MYKYFFSIMLPVLAVMAVNQAIAVSNPPPPSVTETCQGNYAGSSANDTCYNESFREVNSSTCRIAANCWKTPSKYTNVFSAINLDPASAGSVKNCSGRLKLSC